MDFTMMRQMSRYARVRAAFDEDEDLQPLRDILDGTRVNVDQPAKRLSSVEHSKFLTKCDTELDDGLYEKLLRYLRDAGVPCHSAYERMSAADCLNALFLPTKVRTVQQVYVDDRPFNRRASHEGNSNIQFINPSSRQKETGFIETIWQVVLDSVLRVFFLVNLHRPLPAAEEQMAPYVHFDRRFATRIVDAEPSNQFIVIEHQHIITHLTTLERPEGTYGINRKSLVVCWAMNRGRR